MSWIQATKEGVELRVRATPRASRTEIAGLHADALRVRLRAPPVDGKANLALIAFLSQTLGAPRSAISFEAGATGRDKRVRVRGVGLAQASRALGMPVSSGMKIIDG